MPTSHTLTGDLSDVVGTGFPRDSVWVTIKTNLGDNPVFDTAGEQIRFPRHRFALPRNAQFSKSLWSTAALTNPTGYQYGVEVEWPDGAGGTGKKRWFSGWFSLTADKDMSELDYGPMVPPEYYPELTVARDEAVAAKTDAEAAQAAAEAAQAAAEAVGNTNDTIMAGVASDSGSAFSSVLSASTAARQSLRPPILARVSITATGSAPRFVDYWGGYMWGFDPTNGDIFRSNDEGVTWSAYCNSFSAAANLLRIMPTTDGEVLVETPDGVYKSSGWVDGNAATWSANKITLTGTGSTLVAFGIDGDGTKFIVVEYAAPEPNWANSRKGWISLNAGSTFTQVWDSDVDSPLSAPGASHLHAACYDPFRDRFYLSEGHGAGGGVYCSTDDGATWSRAAGMVPDPTDLPGPVLNNGPTVIVATDTGLVMGSDNSPQNGLFGVASEADPADEVMIQTWALKTSAAGLITFAQRGWRDPDTGQVFVTFRSEAATTPVVIAAGTPHTGGEVYRHTLPSVGGVDRFVAVAKTSANRLVAYMETSPAVPALLRGTLTRPGGAADVILDKGNTRGGSSVDPTATASGPGSKATGLRSTAVGTAAAAPQDGTAAGHAATVTAAGGTAVGSGATVANVDAVALGKGSTTQQANEVQVGPRHLSMGRRTLPVIPSNDYVQMYVVNDGNDKDQVVLQFNSGGRRILATEQGLRIVAAADATLGLTDDIVVMSTGGTPRTATLPSAAGRNGFRTTLKNVGTGNVTVASAGGLIDGSSTQTLTQWQFATYMSNGTDWYRIG